MIRGFFTVVFIVVVAAPGGVFAQQPEWAVDLAAYAYVVPGSDDYLQPTVSADRGPIHLEARYNYENQHTVSLWAGFQVDGGTTVRWAFTPMIAGVFGATDGLAPGYNASLSWRRVEAYSEGEYVVVPSDSAGNFFYNWSEATFAPVAWLRLGIVGQRTRAYASPRDIQRGPLIGFTRGHLTVNGQLFNPDDEDPTFVLSVRVSLR